MVGIEQHPGQYWCHYEKGKLKTPRKDTLDRMAKALNVPVEMLLVDSPAPLPPIPDPLPRPTDAEMEAVYQAGYEAGYLAGMTEGMARGGRMAAALARAPQQAPAPTLPEAVAELAATVDAATAAAEAEGLAMGRLDPVFGPDPKPAPLVFFKAPAIGEGLAALMGD